MTWTGGKCEKCGKNVILSCHSTPSGNPSWYGNLEYYRDKEGKVKEKKVTKEELKEYYEKHYCICETDLK